jgi:ABC-type sugar transport system ATPase subunit
MKATPPIVDMRDIRKSFGSTEVLHSVDFHVRPGEVHVLAGENGAGKSTLIKILSGVYGDFSGEMFVGGRQRRFLHPSQAGRAGIATIHQELSLVPTMSISDNLFLGQERAGPLGQVDFRAQENEAQRILEETELDFSPWQLVGDLPISSQQTLEIARALARDAAVVVFDEPTSALGENEVEALFRRILELRRQGRGIVYITHKMEEIYRLADRITVLRDGERVGTAPASELPPDELVRLMVGRDLATQREESESEEDGTSGTPAFPEVVLNVEDLRVIHPRIRSRSVVDGVGFTLQKGEVLGLAGLEGSGKSEVLHALFGALGSRASGRVSFMQQPWALQDPCRSVKRGMVLLTNDRKSLGLAPEMSVTHNVSLSSLRRFSSQSGWVRKRDERVAVESLTRDFRLNAPSLEAPVRALSGGNQQKVYLARCLLPAPRVLLLDEPTRGIDVGAKADIYDLIEGWVGEGIAILLITSEMDELLSLSDRILVMHRGRVAAEFTRDTALKDRILAAAMGHGSHRESWVHGGLREPKEDEWTPPQR